MLFFAWDVLIHPPYGGFLGIRYTMVGHNIYCVSQNFALDGPDGAVVIDNFGDQFNQHNFWAVVAKFSLPRPFSEHMKPFEHSTESARQQQLIKVQWLLQRNVLVLLHTYVFLCIPTTRILAGPGITVETSGSSPEPERKRQTSSVASSLAASPAKSCAGSEAGEPRVRAASMTASLSSSVNSRVGFVPAASRDHGGHGGSHSVRYLRHCLKKYFGPPFLACILEVSVPTPPYTHRVTCPTWCLCVWMLTVLAIR